MEKRINYLPSSPISSKLKKLIDFFGYSLFNRNKKNININLNEIHSISIVNPGHIRDILLMLPILNALRENYKAKITLVVNSYVYPLAKNIKMVDDIHIVPHPKYARSCNASWFQTFKNFRKLKSAIVFVANRYFNSIPFAYISRKNILLDLIQAVFGFLFDVLLDYPFDKHIKEKYYKFLDFLIIKRPKLKRSLKNEENIDC